MSAQTLGTLFPNAARRCGDAPAILFEGAVRSFNDMVCQRPRLAKSSDAILPSSPGIPAF